MSVFKNTKHVVDTRNYHVSERSIANILSYGRLKDSAHAVWQSAEDDFFRVKIVQGGKMYQFKRRCGVYVYRMSTQEHAFISTVRYNVSMYNKRDVERADAAVE